jgi:hypothetical protein
MIVGGLKWNFYLSGDYLKNAPAKAITIFGYATGGNSLPGGG